MKHSVLVQDLAQPLSALLLLGGFYLLSMRLTAVLWSDVISYSLAVLLGYYFLRRLIPVTADANTGAGRGTDALIRFSFVTAIVMLISTMVYWVDRLLVGFFLTATETGIYQAASQVSVIFAVVISGLNRILIPTFAHLDHRGEHVQLLTFPANEVSQAVIRNWDGPQGSDLLRFIRLESTRAEHMLFATQLADGVILAMVFDAETPFSTIRSQASQLVNSLEQGEIEKLSWPGSPRPITPAATGSESAAEEPELEIPPISNIIADVPSPDPQVISDQTRRSIFSREPSPAAAFNDLLTETQNLPQTDLPFGDIAATAPSKSRPRRETPVRSPAPGELDETRPQVSSEVAGRIMLEPVTAGVYHLTYACLLVPRFTTHYLTGDVADRLSQWLPNICIAFGWRLEYLAVRPEYLQWVVNVPPATSPGYLMRIVRQHTSEKVFAEFQAVKKENPSGDFWAPGYLIMGGTQPHPPQLVKDYIRQIRQRQGISQPRK